MNVYVVVLGSLVQQQYQLCQSRLRVAFELPFIIIKRLI